MALRSKKKGNALADNLGHQCKPNTDATIPEHTVRVDAEVEKWLESDEEQIESIFHQSRHLLRCRIFFTQT